MIWQLSDALKIQSFSFQQFARSACCRASRVVLVSILLMAAMCNGLAFADDSEWRHLDKKMETLHQQKQYPQAVIAAEKAVRLAETRFGPNHEFLARSLSGLGLFNEDQGRYPEAERSYLRALAIYETTRGPDHLDIATILSRLGSVAAHQERYAEAEAYYGRSLEIRGKSLDKENPDLKDIVGKMETDLGEMTKSGQGAQIQ